MAKKKSIVGLKFIHNKLGLVLVISKNPKGYTKFIVEQIDRGRGYDDFHGNYVGYKVKLKEGWGWARGQSYDFGVQSEIHKKDLTRYETALESPISPKDRIA